MSTQSSQKQRRPPSLTRCTRSNCSGKWRSMLASPCQAAQRCACVLLSCGQRSQSSSTCVLWGRSELMHACRHRGQHELLPGLVHVQFLTPHRTWSLLTA